MGGGKSSFVRALFENLEKMTNVKQLKKDVTVLYCYNMVPDEFHEIKNACSKSKKYIKTLDSNLGLPDFEKLTKEYSEKKSNTHLIIYMCDMQNYFIKNAKSENVQNFCSFLMNTRRADITCILELHQFPQNLPELSRRFFTFFLSNSTQIVLFKFLSNEKSLNLFVKKTLPDHFIEFKKCLNLSENLCAENNTNEIRPYVLIQLDHRQNPPRKLRIALFKENLVCFLNSKFT